MYHQAPVLFRRHFVFLLLALASFGTGAVASSPDKAITQVSVPWQIAPPGSQLRKKPLAATIYQLDNSPLNGRRPLLMVHGLRGEYRYQFRWGQIIKRFSTYPDFVHQYKIYLLRYDSTAPLSKTVPELKQVLLALSASCGGEPVSIFCLSLGGSLVNECMQDPAVDQAVRLVLALATPFHGSPLFCSDWFQYGLYKNLSYPWTRLDHSLAYRLYFSRNQNLLSDLRWDNADSYMPDIGPFHCRWPAGPSGNLTRQRDANTRLAEFNNNGRVNKKKFITYAGYLLNPYLLPTFKRHLEMTLLAPYTFATMLVPAHLAREHPVLSMLNREISRVIPDTEAPRVANYPHLYGLNDGITPVNSAIFLPSKACQEFPLSSEAEIAKIKDQVDVRLARVFRNIDHLTFVDGYKPHYGSRLLQDELNPEDGQRTIFDWMLSDLMQSESEQLAKESSDSVKD